MHRCSLDNGPMERNGIVGKSRYRMSRCDETRMQKYDKFSKYANYARLQVLIAVQKSVF